MPKARQVAALPIKSTANGSLRVLLVTSRETRRRVIPKGWPWRGHKDYQAAVREAWEEAGVIGTPRKKSIGTYTYTKRSVRGDVMVKVKVFLIAVERLEDDWPEVHERTRAWFSLENAAKAVDEPELAAIITGLTKEKNE